jgi:uncharacterized protein (TIGR03083 family)
LVNRDLIHAATALERRKIADLLDDLDDDQLATPTLCAGWDVKTMGAHLVGTLADGTVRMMLLAARRRGNSNVAQDEMARRWALLPTAEIAARLRELADGSYWRPPPVAPGLLAEILAHGGDIRIPLGLPFEPDPQLTATALDFLTGPVPIGFVPFGRLRGLRLHATDLARTWRAGAEVRGPAAALLMACIGRTAVFDELEGPGLPLLRQRISG